MAAWGALPRFICLYAALYAAFGVSSPFLPALIGSRGIPPEQIGILFAAATALRLLAGPIAGRIADRFHVLRLVFATCAVLAAAAVLCYLPAARFSSLLVVSLLHAAMLAPLTILADALALGAAVPRDDDTSRTGFEYGWVRGAGSAAFIAGSLASGQVIGAGGLSIILWLSAMLLGASAAAVLLVPEVMGPPAVRACDEAAPDGIRALLQLPLFRRLVIIAALVLGSHAMHDSFAVIRWREAGISPATISVLWSEAVAAEVVVFFFIGPALVRRLTPAGAVTLAASAGVLRWAVMAQSADVAMMATVQPLHGVTFALLHLAAMRMIAVIVPRGLAATAQAIYGTVGIGAATALLTLASGALYGRAGAEGFWVMAALCAMALPLTRGLRQRARPA